MKQATFKPRKVVRGGSTSYVIYVPPYLSPTGRKTYHYFRTKADAERRRGEMLASTRTESKLAALSNSQIRDAIRALERLEENGIKLSLEKAIMLAAPSLRAYSCAMTTEQLFRDFAAFKANSWSDASKRAFSTSAKTFLARWGGCSIAAIKTEELEAWYENTFKSSGYRAHEIRTIRPAFSWAVRRRYLAESPYALMESVRVKRKPVSIYTPEEAASLMRSCSPDAVAAFALLLFAGVRPKELTRLTWSNIRDGYIHITADIAKTQQTRNIEIEPNLQAWLDSTGEHAPDEPICPHDWVRKARAIRSKAGVPSIPDTPRHSYASYHLAAYRDIPMLKANMGHAPNSDTLFVHYRAAAIPAVARAYWGIMPQGVSRNG